MPIVKTICQYRDTVGMFGRRYSTSYVPGSGWAVYLNGKKVDEHWYITQDGATNEIERRKAREQQIYGS